MNKNIYSKEKKLVRCVIIFVILLETFEKLCGEKENMMDTIIFFFQAVFPRLLKFWIIVW